MHDGAGGWAPPPLGHTIGVLVRLRWRLLRAAFRAGGVELAGAVLSTLFSVVVGLLVGVALLVAGRHADHLVELTTVACTGIVLAVAGFGIVAGAAQPLDPRVIAAEPLTDRHRSLGLLAASAAGPPGLGGVLVGAGLLIGSVRGPSSAPVVLVGVAAWLLMLLLVARTAINVLGLLAVRFPRLGQFLAGFGALVFYGLFQLVPARLLDLDAAGKARLADALRWTPPGQLGRGIGLAGDRPAAALAHLVVGALILPLLVVASTASTKRLALATHGGRGVRSRDPLSTRPGRVVRRLCGRGVVGAVAWRTLLTRFRTSRTLMETVIGSGLGLAAVLVPAFNDPAPGSGAVLVGGAVQLAVVFVAGNSFGIDGPPIAHELLAGASTSVLVQAKARAAVVVTLPLAVIGPVVAASLSGEWRFLPAGFGVGIGALLAGSGAAVVQSAAVPVAIPDTDNPFAGGESGKGVLAALLLVGVLMGLAIASLPIALALIWALDRGEVSLVTVLAAAAIGAGWGVQRLGVAIATRVLGDRDPQFLAAVTPTR